MNKSIFCVLLFTCDFLSAPKPPVKSKQFETKKPRHSPKAPLVDSEPCPELVQADLLQYYANIHENQPLIIALINFIHRTDRQDLVSILAANYHIERNPNKNTQTQHIPPN